MSDSLSPWLADYLIQSAEQYGAILSSIPLHSKKKKAQITEFLSVGSENQDAFVWVRLSDKRYSIPARLWKETVAEYQRINGRITKDKGAILSIQNFKPMVMRIPMAGGSVTTNPSLALDCQTISLLGSAGEAVFGNPMPITSVRELREWCEGLLQDGGAGNILKERKMQREGNAPGPSKLLPPMPTPPTPAASLSRVQIVAPKVAQPLNRVKVTNIASYNARWQVVERNPALRAPPEEETSDKEGDNDVKEEPTGHPTPSGSRSSSPVTNWENSPSIQDHESPTKAQPTSSGSIPAPTPAQRTRATVAIPETPEITSSYLLGNETALGSEGVEGVSQLSDDMQRGRTVPRKVPRPACPEEEHGERSGPARVLVPNSDTSQSQSQSQPVLRASCLEPAKGRRRVLGGLRLDETEEYPWMSVREVRDMIAATAEMRRLRNE